MKEYVPKLKEAIIPLFGDFMYRNRTLDNPKFMNSADENFIKKTMMIDSILKCYGYGSFGFAGFLIGTYVI